MASPTASSEKPDNNPHCLNQVCWKRETSKTGSKGDFEDLTWAPRPKHSEPTSTHPFSFFRDFKNLCSTRVDGKIAVSTTSFKQITQTFSSTNLNMGTAVRFTFSLFSLARSTPLFCATYQASFLRKQSDDLTSASVQMALVDNSVMLCVGVLLTLFSHLPCYS